MAFLSGTVFSCELKMHTSLRIIIPQDIHAKSVKDRKILYLLHGLSDDSSMWMRQTRIEPYAVENNYVVIMPEVHRSFYTNMKHGGNYFSYIVDELPDLCERVFGIKKEREKTFVAGLSMGGYGALKCGLSRPKQYAACAGFSGALDMKARFDAERERIWVEEKYAAFGENGTFQKEDNLIFLAKKTNSLSKAQKPRVYVSCGLDDRLLPENRDFRDELNKMDYDFKYMEWEGDHTWSFWDQSLLYMFEFFAKN